MSTQFMRTAAALAAFALPLLAAACASAPAAAPADAGWTGGDPARLKGDLAACRKESEQVDVNQVSGYSDSRYGMTSAMAAAIDRDDPLADHAASARSAAFAACMADKGWRQP